MNFAGIQAFVCNKVSKTDSFSQARCNDFILARHKMIYESYDWKAAQTVLDFTIVSGANTTTFACAGIHHILAVRLDYNQLQPVSASFVFDNSFQANDLYSTAAVPIFYEEYRDPVSQIVSVRLFPPNKDDGNNHTLSVLGKLPYLDSWNSVVIPQTENALIAFVTGDMWEYLHQVGKAQAKFQEGATLLQQAQKMDTPEARRPRSQRYTTPEGNSMAELTDNVCDIIGDYTPTIVNSVKMRLRRNHRLIWDYCLWPESNILVNAAAPDQGFAILPHLVDKVLAVRTNLDPPTSPLVHYNLDYVSAEVWFNLKPDIFDTIQQGNPTSFQMLLPVALPVSINSQALVMKLSGTEQGSVIVTVKGENSTGDEIDEDVLASTAGTQTVNNTYSLALTIRKPPTKNSLQVKDTTGRILMTLGPDEQERKYPRLNVYPNYNSTQDTSLFVYGKRVCPQFFRDGDTAALTGIENILINSTVADMFLKMGKPDQAQPFKEASASALQVMYDREVKQGMFSRQVLPYTELPLADTNSTEGFIIP